DEMVASDDLVSGSEPAAETRIEIVDARVNDGDAVALAAIRRVRERARQANHGAEARVRRHGSLGGNGGGGARQVGDLHIIDVERLLPPGLVKSVVRTGSGRDQTIFENFDCQTNLGRARARRRLVGADLGPRPNIGPIHERIPSATWRPPLPLLGRGNVGPWLCVPTSPWVCSYRES